MYKCYIIIYIIYRNIVYKYYILYMYYYYNIIYIIHIHILYIYISPLLQPIQPKAFSVFSILPEIQWKACQQGDLRQD